MKYFWTKLRKLTFGNISGINALDESISKFRKLRDSYRDANRKYYGEYVFSILDQK